MHAGVLLISLGEGAGGRALPVLRPPGGGPVPACVAGTEFAAHAASR